MNTSKGFTGQYNDSLSGLDYYGSRYYDPTAGVFLCADPMQGDLAATNPCEYVGANPETNTDPTGQMDASPPGWRVCATVGAAEGGLGELGQWKRHEPSAALLLWRYCPIGLFAGPIGSADGLAGASSGLRPHWPLQWRRSLLLCRKQRCGGECRLRGVRDSLDEQDGFRLLFLWQRGRDDNDHHDGARLERHSG